MQLQVDTHTHTYASGHAYSTLVENAKVAKENGLKLLCTTDHSSAMPGAPHYWFFNNQRVLPRFINDIGIIRGVETNIMNIQGEMDLHPTVYVNLDWIIASFHEAVIKPTNADDHTQALLNTIKSGKIDALGHLGNPNYDFDFETVIQCAKEHNVAIELNNSSLKGHSRAGSQSRCEHIAEIVKGVGGLITTGSDAHFCDDVGRFENVSNLIDRVGIPPEQIITHTPRQFLDFLIMRGKAPIDEFETL